jgi:hypothetical protein
MIVGRMESMEGIIMSENVRTISYLLIFGSRYYNTTEFGTRD